MNWNTVRTFGKVKYLRLTFLVPILTIVFYKIYKLSPDSKLFYFLHKIGIAWPSTLLWEEISFYYGLLFLSFGSFIYFLFCPKVIKQYESSNSYIIAVKDLISIDTKTDIFNWLVNQGYKSEQSPTSIPISDLLKIEYIYKSKKYIIIIIISFMIYLIGTLLCVIPLIMKIISITIGLLKSIL